MGSRAALGRGQPRARERRENGGGARRSTTCPRRTVRVPRPIKVAAQPTTEVLERAVTVVEVEPVRVLAIARGVQVREPIAVEISPRSAVPAVHNF